ncbi:MAG: hypothetical protein ACRCUK_01250, partial [Plesiomonas shigelloides]
SEGVLIGGLFENEGLHDALLGQYRIIKKKSDDKIKRKQNQICALTPQCKPREKLLFTAQYWEVWRF